MTRSSLTSLSKQPIAVLGAGVTGASVVRHLDALGCEVLWLDTRPSQADVDDRVQWNVNQWPQADVEYAVVSPGLELDACVVRGAVAAGVTILSDIDLFFLSVQEPVIGITGTNGKSTVTSLVGHLLNENGISCGVGGNLGDAALDIIDAAHQCYVLELSSFQLERSAEHSYAAAAILNITEDHLDKHADMQAYVDSKQRIFRTSRCLVFNREDPLSIPRDHSQAMSFGLTEPSSPQQWGVTQSDGERWFCQGDQLICPTTDMPLPGAHNELNALAAFALVSPLLDHASMATALPGFRGLQHRFETVLETRGVRYINDSKATNLGATMAALAGFAANNKVVLIAGGDAKGVDLSPLGELLFGRVRHLVVLGKDAQQLANLGKQVGVDVRVVATLPQAVALAAELSRRGDAVLLSPACASLDMFKNYAERGEVFAAAVHQVAGAQS